MIKLDKTYWTGVVVGLTVWLISIFLVIDVFAVISPLYAMVLGGVCTVIAETAQTMIVDYLNGLKMKDQLNRANNAES